MGIIVGLAAGKILHYFVVITSEVDLVLFNRQLVWWAYVLGALLTLAFAFIVNLVLHFKQKDRYGRIFKISRIDGGIIMDILKKTAILKITAQ